MRLIAMVSELCYWYPSTEIAANCGWFRVEIGGSESIICPSDRVSREQVISECEVPVLFSPKLYSNPVLLYPETRAALPRIPHY